MSNHAPSSATQTAAARTLLALVTQFPDLPAVGFDITAYPVGANLRVNAHDPAAFEQWREALAMDPQTAAGEPYDTFHTIEITRDFDGIRLLLVGYMPLPVESAEPAPIAA